ncbi:MAG TPA: hypothetical protein VF128_05215 [Gemmatimonadaceae bacterium]
MNPAPDKPRVARRLEGVALLLIAVSAILFQLAATRPWAEGRSQWGNKLEVSPIGVADFGLNSDTARVQCRWWPRIGDATLCEVAPDGETAMTRLRRAYPLAIAALWTSVLALFLVALRLPRSAPFIGILATLAVPVLAVSALWSMASSFTTALSALQGATLHVAQHGFGGMFAGALLTAIAVGLLLVSGMTRASAQNRPPS